MNKIFLIMFSAIISSFLYSVQPEKIQTLSTKIIVSKEEGYYVLSDSSCWKVIAISQRWRTFSEWWNNAKLVPETFSCKPNDWDLGMPIEIYAKMGFPELPLEENISNKDSLAKSSHVLINSRTRQIIFARALETADCITQVFEAGHKEGYSSGHSCGYSEGLHSGRGNAYSEGYSQGSHEGYTKGFDAGIQEGLRRKYLHQPY